MQNLEAAGTMTLKNKEQIYMQHTGIKTGKGYIYNIQSSVVSYKVILFYSEKHIDTVYKHKILIKEPILKEILSNKIDITFLSLPKYH